MLPPSDKLLPPRMSTGSCRVLERKRPTEIDRPLTHCRVIYTIGRDYDRELDLRRQFIQEVLLEENDIGDDGSSGGSGGENRHCCHCRAAATTTAIPESSAVVLHAMSMYFSYFYDILRVVHVPTMTASFGADLNAATRELAVVCNNEMLTNAILAAEAIREERVIVNDRPVPAAYVSRIDKRVYSLMALIANVERMVYGALREISPELTLVEMIFVNEEDIRGRCDVSSSALRLRQHCNSGSLGQRQRQRQRQCDNAPLQSAVAERQIDPFML